MRSTHNSIKLRTWKVAACLIAVLALFASGVSACACSHHQPQVKAEEKPSCHSASHSELPAADAEDTAYSDSLGPGCNCFVGSRVPAITAKSENKKFSAEKLIAAGDTFAPTAPIFLCSTSNRAAFDLPDLGYSRRLISSGPSRAPPRL